jgi:hypothetical protein
MAVSRSHPNKFILKFAPAQHAVTGFLRQAHHPRRIDAHQVAAPLSHLGAAYMNRRDFITLIGGATAFPAAVSIP